MMHVPAPGNKFFGETLPLRGTTLRNLNPQIYSVLSPGLPVTGTLFQIASDVK